MKRKKPEVPAKPFSVYKTKRYRIVSSGDYIDNSKDKLNAEIRFDLAKFEDQPIKTVSTKLIVYDEQTNHSIDIELDQLQLERLIEVLSIGLDPDTGFYKI